jgi:Family of unknown function (DUF6161)
MPESEPFLTFDLPKGRGAKSFETLEEFETWFSNQSRWWQKLGGQQSQNQEAYNRWSNLEAFFRQQLSTLKNPNIQPDQKRQAINGIRSNLSQNYTPGYMPEADSDEGQIISRYQQQAPNLAYGFLASISAPTLSLQGKDPMFWSGFLLGGLHRVGMLKDTEVDFNHLGSVEKEWRDRLQALHADTSLANRDSQSFLEEIQREKKAQAEDTQKQRETVADELRQQKEDLLAFCKKTEDECKQWQDSFNRDLAFRAPVTYWKKKAKVHGIASIVWGVVWLVVGFSSVGGILQVIRPFLAPDTKIDYQHGALILLLSGFAIWLMRILTRMFLSNVHQSSDASQRKTMVETYLALEEEGKLTEEQRTMIIEAMFRPVTMGVVKEDETPSHPFAFVSKLVSKE